MTARAAASRDRLAERHPAASLLRMPILPCAVLLALGAVFHQTSKAADVEFEGFPVVKVEVYEGSAQSQPVLQSRAREFGVRVVRHGSNYVWASRNNVPLVKHESGAYVTYVASTGAGYIRVLSSPMRKARQSLPPDQREREFVYVEHMVNQLGSVTYYGR